jgi:hypothetical protein
MHWMRATEAALPQFDLEKDAERLLHAHEILVPRRARRRPWAAAAALAAAAAIFLGAAARSEGGRGRHAETWQDLERSGQFERAVEEVERIGPGTIYELANTEDLTTLARAARFAGREDVSTGALLSCRRRFPVSRESALAAYFLGRSAPPIEAAEWFSTYLAEQPDGVWAREASGRMIEAHRASGNTRGARDAAQRYLIRYPTGPHADFARTVLE